MNNYVNVPDSELTALIKSGDHAAFAELYNRYAVPMYYKVNQMLRDEEASKDLIQELFISLWSKTELLQADNNISGYLYTSARHRVLKHIQKNKLKNDYLSSLASYAREVSSTTIDDIDERELSRIIQQEIDLLPPKMKVIFEMSRKQNLSHAQIGKQLGISDLTVKKQVRNALKILRGKITAFGPSAIIILSMSKKI